MTKVKICGISRHEEIAYINEVCPEYAGFVFAPSRRQVTLAKARTLVSALRPEVIPVGVFQDHGVGEVMEVSAECGLQIAQLHGDESPTDCQGISLGVWKTIGVGQALDITKVAQYQSVVSGILFDTVTPEATGGSGRRFPWEVLVALSLPLPMILAGGLNSANVGEAISLLAPDVVDVSSGVEVCGVKNKMQIISFVGKVRNSHGK